MQEYREIEKLLEKMRSVGKGGISADVPNIMGKLDKKLEAMQVDQDFMKVETRRRKRRIRHKTNKLNIM